MINKYFALLIASLLAIGCNNECVKDVENLIDQRDGQSYRCKQIGNQTWMVENLAYETPNGQSVWYANNHSKYGQLGRLYTKQDLKDAVQIPGWHLPDSSEWNELLTYY